MFIKSLIISAGNKIIREINFRRGINFIVDESENQITGNNIGKTTTLKLIDFCLGGESKEIYLDPDSRKNEHTLVKNFLIGKKVLITLILKQNLDIFDSEEIVIERNFLSRKECIRKINGENFSEKEFEQKLLQLIYSHHNVEKPTFRQIISHHIRCEDKNEHTLKTLNKYTTDAEYETLFLFLFGCNVENSDREEILAKIKQEETFKKRIEKQQTKSFYETALKVLEDEILILKQKKEKLNSNENLMEDFEKLDNVKYKINKMSSEISTLNIRRRTILEAKQSLESDFANIDSEQLYIIYQQATKLIDGIQKTFEDLVKYHNLMIKEKVKFITQDLPNLEKKLELKNQDLEKLKKVKDELISLTQQTDTMEEMRKLDIELHDKFRLKGEYETMINQLSEIEQELEKLSEQLINVDEKLFSKDTEQIVKNQKDKFNKFFAAISKELYEESYALNCEIKRNNKGIKFYDFTTFNLNIGSGKKQGEISCFDIAYILFAENENIPCLHFVLNDRKELMDDKQLIKIAEFVNNNQIQFVVAILKDKLPQELNKKEYFILKLSQKDKLFKIE